MGARGAHFGFKSGVSWGEEGTREEEKVWARRDNRKGGGETGYLRKRHKRSKGRKENV